MRRKLFLLFLIVPLAAATGGCFSFFGGEDSEEESGGVTGQGVDPAKDPLGALSALTSMGSELEQLQQELEAMPDVETVGYDALIAALPDVPSGWTADDPSGQTNQMGDFKTSVASRTYRSEDSDAQVKIEVNDWAFHKAVYLPFIMSAKFSQEGTSGYNRGITVDGEHPGREEYKTGNERGERSVLWLKRYLVKISIRNLEPEAFDAWWDRVKVDALPAAQ